ncbi:MAG: LLM class flavin-dependent oxidoreductase [Gammaproteobacteria bacterium]|nr:LLM class flavin-dependent oxidoreductase [Gammaproteobacteria bacterium]
MRFDLMTGNLTWRESADLARDVEAAGFSGMLFTETSQVPWMMIAAAATAAPKLELSTGIAVAFPRSPMISAQIAWELARNTRGRFRLGLGSQVRAHITRRYATSFDRPATRMRELVTDEMLEHFAVVARWDDLADVLIRRYEGVANRLVTYLARDMIRRDATMLGRWGEIARAIAS